MPLLLTIDPGSTQSAYLLYDTSAPHTFPLVVPDRGILDNDALRYRLVSGVTFCVANLLVIEQVESYGMPVGREVFETVLWTGRFVEAWGGTFALLPRREVKLHLCHSSKATDATIRQALIDQFGGNDRAIGRKKTPGPLYDIKKDLWSCLGLGVTYAAHAHMETCPQCGWERRDKEA